MVLYREGPITSRCSQVLQTLRNHTNTRSRRILFVKFIILVFLVAIGLVRRTSSKNLSILNDSEENSSDVYYISKRTLCSRSIAYDQLGIQPIAVAKVILRPLVQTPPFEGYDDRLEVIEEGLINDVVFLDRNVSGKEAELSAHVCPLHTVSILPSQNPKRYTASEILFGVMMEVDEIPSALEQWRFWARHSKASFYVLLPNKDHNKVRKAQDLFKKVLGVKVIVEAAKDPVEPRGSMLMLIEKMRQAASSEIRWYMILSPTTFITSTDDVLLALDQYDASMPMYLGTISESKGQRDQYGVFAYGGAGIVLSRPLAETIAEHGTFPLYSTNLAPQCLEIHETPYADGLLSHCINRFTSSEFTLLPTFHQTDLLEDISGMLQGPLEFATMNNISADSVTIFPSWHPVGPETPIPSTFTDQLELFYHSRDILGSPNWGMRYRFGRNGRYVLTNGYSITEFLRPPFPTNFAIRGGVEGTFYNDNEAEEFTFHANHYGEIKEVPMRHGLREADDKRTYYLRAIEMRHTQASLARAQKMNRKKKEAAVFIYTNEWGSVRRGIEVVWLLP